MEQGAGVASGVPVDVFVSVDDGVVFGSRELLGESVATGDPVLDGVSPAVPVREVVPVGVEDADMDSCVADAVPVDDPVGVAVSVTDPVGVLDGVTDPVGVLDGVMEPVTVADADTDPDGVPRGVRELVGVTDGV